MKKMICTFLLVISFNLFAADPANDVNYFHELKSLWDNGSPVEINQISNKLLSGRCFDSKAPTTPRNAALVIKLYYTNYYHYELLGNVLYAPNQKPNYFDSMSLKDLSRFQNIPFYKVGSSNVGTTIYFPASGKHQLRVHNQFIISDYSIIDPSDDVGPIDESNRQSTMRCYFFN